MDDKDNQNSDNSQDRDTPDKRNTTRKNKIKKIMKFILWSIYTIVIGLIALEIIFQLLPVSKKLKSISSVTSEIPILRFEPDQDFTFSLGTTFYQVVRKHINNYGFVSDVDYVQGSKPDVAVIGDSYVEALQVDYWDSIMGRINAHNAGGAISLGVSGSPLSQYLVFAEYAMSEFQPQKLLFVIGGNDFDESLCQVKFSPGYHCFDDEFNNIFVETTPVSGIRSSIREFLNVSALISYISVNAKIDMVDYLKRIAIALNLIEDLNPVYVANTNFTNESEIVEKSIRVVDLFLDEVHRIAGDIPVLFVVDSDRGSMYDGKRYPESYFEQMRAYFINAASESGYEVVDMHPVFTQHYAKHEQRFEFPTDGHWNELGHELAFEAVSDRGFLSRED